MREQADTVGATAEEIMRSPEFQRGVDDARQGRAFDWRVDSWDYERGRLWANLAPLDLPLYVGKNLNPRAVALCRAAFARKWVI